MPKLVLVASKLAGRSRAVRPPTRRRAWWAVGAVLAALVGPAPARAQENVELTPANCPVCNAKQIADWEFADANQLGVTGEDPVGAWIGLWPAERFFGSVYNNWYPQSSVKQTGCGVLSEFGFYDGDGAEADFNLHMFPAPAFEFLYDEVARRHHPTKRWRVGRKKLAGRFEAEITPDEAFYENPWFSKSRAEDHDDPTSPLVDQSLCVYGPWVAEHAHD